MNNGEDIAIRHALVASDHYKLLCLKRDASEHDIKQAYRQLSRKLHPDKAAAGAEERAEAAFKRLGEAYSTLSDPIERARYDEALARPAAAQKRPTEPAARAPKEPTVDAAELQRLLEEQLLCEARARQASLILICIGSLGCISLAAAVGTASAMFDASSRLGALGCLGGAVVVMLLPFWGPTLLVYSALAFGVAMEYAAIALFDGVPLMVRFLGPLVLHALWWATLPMRLGFQGLMAGRRHLDLWANASVDSVPSSSRGAAGKKKRGK
jgi:hypothetical protein